MFTYTINEKRQRYLELLDGKLLLVTNTDAPAAEVVQRYKSLADIERGFRVLKSDIEIGPVYHRLPRRIRAHSLICFMALILYRVMRMRLKANGRDESPTRLLEQLRRVQQQTVQTVDGQTLSGLTELVRPARSRYSGLICTLRHLIGPPVTPLTPAPYCSANGPLANLPLFIVTLSVPLNLTVTTGPRASISKVFQRPPAL